MQGRSPSQPSSGPGPFVPPLTEADRDSRRFSRRSLRARLAGGPLLQAVGRADTAGMRWTRRQARSRRATALVRRYSRLGEHGGLWVGVGLTGMAIDHGNRQRWARGLAGVAAAYLANTSLKQVARRPRPDFADLPPLIKTPGPLSFPSSHSSSSAAAFVGYAPMLPTTPLAVAAAAMAISRVHLGVHYPSDIAVGATLGTVVAKAVDAALRPD